VGSALTGTVAPGESDVTVVDVGEGETVAIGAEESTGRAVRLSLRGPDGTVRGASEADLDPGPAVQALLTDLAPGDHQLVVEAQVDHRTRYEVWLAAGPELSATPAGTTHAGELPGTVAGELLVLRGTGTTVEVTAHSDASSVAVTVQPLGAPPELDVTSLIVDYGLGALQCPPDPDTDFARLGVRRSFPTRQGEVYRVYVRSYDADPGQPYSVTAVASPAAPLALGQASSQRLPSLESASFDLPDDATEVSVAATGDLRALQLTVTTGGGPEPPECVSQHDLAGARLALPEGPDRSLLVLNVGSAPAAVVVTAT